MGSLRVLRFCRALQGLQEFRAIPGFAVVVFSIDA